MGFWTKIGKTITRYQAGIITVTIIYIVAMIGQSLLGRLSQTQAETPLATHRLVAVLVQESLLEDVRDDLERYTQSYMPSRVDNVMPLIISIYPDYTPRDIQNTLENLYFEGLIDQPSTLEGVIVVGDVPLATVRDQDTSYQTVFPYVDFEDVAYRWSESADRFESTEHILHPQAELWHGLMNRGEDPQIYRDYFSKLKIYDQDPSSFVEKRIWVDDFTNIPTVIDPNKYGYYLQQSIFAEDINYRRYTPLLLALLQGVHNDRVENALAATSDMDPLPLSGDESDDFVTALNQYTSFLHDTLISDEEGAPNTSSESVPTLLLQESINSLLLSYPELMSQGYRADIEEIIQSAGRWSMDEVDSHTQKLFLLDSVVQGTADIPGLMTRVNTLLESAIIQVVDENNYAVPYPLFVGAKQGGSYELLGPLGPIGASCRTTHYEAMYHGRNALLVDDATDVSIYQGTYGNQNILTGTDILINPLTSIGASYSIFNTQIAANRGYNMLNAEDQNIISNMNNIDSTRCDEMDVDDFVQSYWGGNTLFNMTTGADGAMVLDIHSLQQARNPYRGGYDFSIGGPVFDQAGSYAIDEEQSDAYSYKIVNDVSIQQVDRVRRQNIFDDWDVEHMPFCSNQRFSWGSRPYDFFTAWSASIAIELLNGATRGSYDNCESSSRHYTYKLIDSTIINASPTPEQISAMNITTPDRPIDSDHTITFQGLDADVVTLEMPNLWDIDVFTGDIMGVELLTPDRIEDNIRSYLLSVVEEYNTILTDQNELGPNHFANNQAAYMFLGTADPLAVVNRQYELLSDNFLIEVLGDEYIKQLAAALYRQNLPWKQLTREEVIVDDINILLEQGQLDYKIAHIVTNYLHEDPATVLMPDYQSNGYESVILHSDSNQTNVTQSPLSWDIADTIRQRRARESQGFMSTDSVSDQNAVYDASMCGYAPGAPVALVGQWLDALQCRWEITAEKPFDVTFTLPDITEWGQQTIDNMVASWENYSETFSIQQETIQSISELIADEGSMNESILDTLDPSLRAPLRRIYNNINLTWSDDVLTIDELDTVSVMIMSEESIPDTISLSLVTTGAQCLTIANQNTCQNGVTIDTEQLENDPRIASVGFESQQAGMIAAQVNICDTVESVCLTKSSSLTLTPGQLADAVLLLPTATVAAGGLIPVRIQATDAGGNRVGIQPYPVIGQSVESRFENGPQQLTSATAYNPQTSTRRYRAPTATASMRQMRSEDNIARQTQAPQLTFDTLSLTQAAVSDATITYDTRDIISTPITIESSIIYEGENGSNLTIGLDPSMDPNRTDTLPRIVITVRDQQGNPLPDQFFALMTNNVTSHIINTDGETPALWTTDNQGQITAYVVPHGGMGESVIDIRLYGSDQRIQNTINRGPGDPYRVTINTPDDILSPEQTTTFDVSVADYRGNIIEDETPIRIALRGPLTASASQTSFTIAVDEFPITLTAGDRGQAVAVAMIDGVPIDAQLADVHERVVAEQLLDMDHLNTMTMVLDGRGWGDYTTDEGQAIVRSAFATSEKLLAMSTILTPPEQIGTSGYREPRLIDAIPGDSIANIFQDDSMPITDWAQGATWGEAHRSYGTPLMVVYGDPLLYTTGDELSTTTHDTQRGERIYTNTNKVIHQTLAFDLNADELEDLLIIYTDGSIHILKNYGGQTEPYVDLGELMIIGSDIQEVFVGDIDANGYDDIIIRTVDHQLRAYPNDHGMIDVDGYPICLPVPNGPDRLDGVHQLFIRDMDLDGALDIVTNDSHGVVAITYGGSPASYLSQDRIICDEDWEERVITERTIVTQMGVELTDDIVRDSSLIHWNGLTYTSNEVGNSTYAGPSQAAIDALIDDNEIDPAALNALFTQQMTTNTDELIAASIGEAYRYIASPMRFIPIYYDNNAMAYRDLYYVPAYSQRNNDPITIEKKYTDHDGGLLLPGDSVTVTVVATAIQDTVITYVDYGRGAREVEKSINYDRAVVGQAITSFDRTQIDSEAIYRDAPTPDYLYMLDNLSFTAGQTRTRSYDLTYAGGPLIDIDVREFNPEDEYPDIIILPTDSCRQIRQERINKVIDDNRSYQGNITDLGVIQQAESDEGASDMENNQNELAGDIQDAMVNQDPSSLDVLQQIGESWTQDFFADYMQGGSFWENIDQGLQNGNQFSSTINLDVSVDPALISAYQDITQGLCQGFGVGAGCGGLPVPFNMAFLAPGDLQVMGCKIFEDKGLPTFFFPGTLITPVGPVPIPYGLKGPGDSFYWAPGGSYPSQIRIYTAPTLTQQMGIAICLGPMAAGMNIPAPFKNLGGNCIVTAIGLDSSCSDDIDADIRPDGANSLSADWYDISQRGSCTNPAAQIGQMIENPPTTSPFLEATWQTIADTRDNPGNDNNGFPPVSSLNGGPMLGGMLFLDQAPINVDIITTVSGDRGVQLIPGQDTNNQIQGGHGGGLAQCIVQGWLDPQITYIANNLTTLNITVYLPDLASITQGLNTITSQTIADIRQTPSIDVGNTTTPSQSSTSSEEKLIDTILLQKTQIENADNALNNPFEKLEQVFAEVPLINISKQNIPIHIPMLTDEDITAYESSMREWMTHNGNILRERTNIGNAVFGVCGQVANIEGIDELNPTILNQKGSGLIASLTHITNTSSDPDTVTLASSCLDVLVSGKLEAMIIFQQDMSSLLQLVQSNMNSLRTYKEFPSQLTELLGSVDRYVADVASFVTNFFGQINERLSTNARIFNAYIDAIIGMQVAIETRQAMIDLSVDRQQSCSTCSNDNYGSYSCNLQFMCPSNLPILQFPPLKIPDIYIDLSHIDAGVELTLPEISFISQSVTLPILPTIPEPPVMDVDFTVDDRSDIAIEEALGLLFDIPDIPPLPQLPTLSPAPTLPQLPPLIPQVNMSLPYLPPPPEIPSLSPSIQQMITVGETIGELFCIMKGEIGLVAEAGVKAKIEQLTQRTYNVPLFDYFNLTHLHDAPTLQGMDLEVASFVDFNMNIDAIYSILDSVASVANNFTNKLRTGTDMFLQQSAGAAAGSASELEDDFNIDLQGAIPQTNWDDLLTSIALIQEERNTPSDDLSRFATIVQDRQLSPDLVSFDIKTITREQESVIASLDTYRIQLAAVHTTLNPERMDSVLALVDKETLIPAEDQSLIASVVVPGGLDEVRRMNPVQDYLAGWGEVIASYEQDITRNTARDLALTEQVYKQMRTSITQTKALVTGIIDPTDTRPSFAATADRLAQNTSSTSSSTMSYDYSQYLQGTYFLSDEIAYDVIASEYWEDKIIGYTQIDLNHDDADEIILRDGQSIYIKYADNYYIHEPHLLHGDEGDVRYIDMGPNRENRENDGSITSLYNDRFRVRSFLPVVHQVTTQGQSFDTITFSRSDSATYGWEYDGYLVRLTQRVDVYHDSAHTDVISPPLREQYVLVIGSDRIQPQYIRLERDQGYQSVQTLLDQERLIILETTLPIQDVVLTLSELNRNRHYAQVAHMQADNLIPSNLNNSITPRLTIASPWSSQAVAGPQIIADDNPPLPLVQLQRERLDNLVVGSGLSLGGYVGTYYTLDIQRDDSSGTENNRIRRPDGEERTYEGEQATRSGLFFTGTTQYEIVIGAEDTQNNVGERAVILRIESPEITILDVQSSGQTGTITAELSQDIDDGIVQFERQNASSPRSLLSGINGVDNPITTSQTIITGGVYTIGDMIGFYTDDGTQIAAMDPHTGEIMFTTVGYEVIGSRADHYLRRIIRDIAADTPLFEVTLPIQTIISSEIVHPAYMWESVTLGDFTECLIYDNQCIVARNDENHLVIPAPHNYAYYGTYSFDVDTDQIQMTVVRQSDNQPVARLVMESIDLLPSIN